MRQWYRKGLVIGTINLNALSVGFTYGHQAELIRSLQKREDGIDVSGTQIYLIATSLIFCCVVAVAVLGLFGERVGRRLSVSLYSVPMLLNWAVLYQANHFSTLLLSRILAGFASGGLAILNLVVAGEYTSPKFRAINLSIVALVTPAIGTAIGHASGLVVHWRALSILGFVTVLLLLCLPYFWVESPQWLASRGRFEECKKNYRELHKINSKTDNELSLLVEMETKKQKLAMETDRNTDRKRIVNALKKKYVWHLMLTSCVIYIYYSVAGKTIFTNLATVILEQITGNSDVLIFTLLIDVFIIVGTCTSIVLIRKLSIRVLLFSTGVTANIILIVLSASLYFKNGETYFQWINVILLAIYFIIVHVGPYPVLEILLGEIFPVDIKLFCFLLSTPAMAASLCSAILLMPIIVDAIGFHGLFLMNSTVGFLCLGYFWAKMPETKEKTLQEIELYYTNNKCIVDQVQCNEEIKTFV